MLRMEDSIFQDKLHDLGVSIDTLCQNIHSSRRVLELNKVLLNHIEQRNLPQHIDQNMHFYSIQRTVWSGYLKRCTVMLLVTENYTKNLLHTNTISPYQDILNKYKARLEKKYKEITQKIKKFTELIQNQVGAPQTVDCPICFREKVNGIKPECCDSKQSICLSCLYTTMFEQYKKIKNIELQNVTIDELLCKRYSCCFCRTVSSYKKYSVLLKGNLSNALCALDETL
jgi:hypothetical protein